jgi:hypothetical protein
MTKELDNPNVSRRAFLAKASGAVAVGHLVIKCSGKAASLGGPTSTKWEVTVTPDYTTTPPTVNYSLPDGTDAYLLPVQPGDTVLWKAKIKHTHSHLSVLFVGETPFVHNSGSAPVFAFHGSESDIVGKDASISTAVQDGDSWEYYVGVWDDDGSPTVATATDDPTIIIGRGMLGTASARAKSIAARRLLERAEKDYPEDANRLKSIAGELNKLIDKWEKLLKPKK